LLHANSICGKKEVSEFEGYTFVTIRHEPVSLKAIRNSIYEGLSRLARS